LERKRVFEEPCNCCGNDIRYGSAIVQITRTVEQIDKNPSGKGLIIDVIDDVELANICFECGNKNFAPRRLRRQLAESLEIPEPKQIIEYHDYEILQVPEPCACCGCTIHAGNAQIDVGIMIAQIDWSEDYDDTLITPIYAESLFTFCAACGNRMSEFRLRTAIKELLVYAESPEDDCDNEYEENNDTSELTQVSCGTETKPIKIIDVGAEGGGITLFGWKDDKGVWHYLRETDERTLMGIMSKEDQKGVCFYSKSESVTDWNEALKMMYRYPWPCLFPLYVHPEFAELVQCELKRASKRWEHIDFHHWDAVCAGKCMF